MGAYVKLLEYNNVEGMILMTELSRRRIRSINKLLRVGKQEVVMVLRVDRERGALFLPSLFFPLTAYEKIKSSNRVYRSVKKGCVGRRCSVDGGALQQSKGGTLSRRGAVAEKLGHQTVLNSFVTPHSRCTALCEMSAKNPAHQWRTYMSK